MLQFYIFMKTLSCKKMSDLQRLTIKKTRNTPYVDLDPQTGLLIFQGVSIAENPESFFRPVYQWLENYLQEPHQITTVKFFFYSLIPFFYENSRGF